MDLRSFRLNFEVHALVHDAGTAAAVCSAFQSYEVGSERVQRDAWSQRAWGLKLKEGAARLVSPLL